jgi:hypothetical protein
LPQSDSAGRPVTGKVEGDTLTICRPVGTGMARPKEFKSPPGSNLSLEVYKRKK